MRSVRMIRVCFLVGLLLGGASRFADAQAGEPEKPLATRSDSSLGDLEEYAAAEKQWIRGIQSDLVQGKFDHLDRMANEYRVDRTRLPGGPWRLRAFYDALDAPQLTDKDTIDHLGHLEAWIKLRPESITARVAYASSLVRWAWVARGNGLGNTVTPDGWRLFQERIGDARQVLQQSANMRTMCPQWFFEEMIVGLAQGWDERKIQDVFERGIQFERDYYYLYKEYANYLMPKWYGKPGAAARFAMDSADHLGGDRGEILYFQIAAEIISRHSGSFPVHEMDWQRIQRGYTLLVAQAGPSNRVRNILGYMAWRYKDGPVGRQQFRLIEEDWNRNVWGNRRLFDRARDWAESGI